MREQSNWIREREGVYRSRDGRHLILRDRRLNDFGEKANFHKDSWDVCTSRPVRLLRPGLSTLADAKAFADSQGGDN